jgi:hypothetical protein
MAKVEITSELERDAFRTFAEIYPHEAAECNFEEFAASVRSKNPAIPDNEIRRILRQTAEPSVESAQSADKGSK